MKDYLDAFDTSMLPESLRGAANRAATQLVAGLQRNGLWPKIGHDLDDVAGVLAQHPEKPRLFEIANPRFQPSADPSNTFVLILEENGEPVASAACRLKWLEESLRRAFERQTLLFDDTAMIPPTSAFLCETPLAERIEAQHVVVTTGVCVLGKRPGALKAMLRLLHLRAFVVWQWAYIVAICTPEFAAKYPLDVEGFSTICGRFRWLRDGEWKRYRLVLAERSHWRHIVADPDSLADLAVTLGEHR